METVITRTGLCNIRSGPGTENELVFQAEKGVPFKVIGRKGKWIRVRHADGDTGWIHSKLVW
jgi:SH3-like domain-containing protein